MDEEIRVVSFDMDGTLIPKRFADDFWLERIPELYSEKKGLPLEEAKEKLIEEYDEMGRDDIRWYEPEYWFSRCGLDQDLREVLEELRAEYDLYHDAKKVMEELNHEYELIVISNGIKMFIEVGLGDHKSCFSDLYSSVSDFRMSSKTPSLYRSVCRELQIDPKKVVHVGDDRENDYEPAEEAGMRSYLLDREGKSEDGLADLRELLEIL
ncbi:MAG: HAD family hydrolase [Thermoplasmata archaeon]